jgi:DNA helicase-2/ATP-dependent DNA helicase PcrA
MVDTDRIAELFADYDRALVRRRSLDLDDVLVRSGDLLLGDAAFAERMHWRYRHLSVDEFQDVNPAQFRLIHALVGSRRDLCAVGDPNQAIYGWNGADPTLLDRLPDTVADMAVVRLDENHRSTPQVVAAATAGLGHAVTVPHRSLAEDGPMPVVTAFEDETAEAEGIVSSILERSEAGRPFSDQAVLARTHDQLSQIGKALERAGIPYRVAPGPESPAAESPGAPGAGNDVAGPAGRAGRAGQADRAGRTSGGGVGRADSGSNAPDAVELATFHRAKGLEWTSVYVVGVEDGFVPIVYATSQMSRDEERRLLYVALTRASRELHCSWARVRRMGNGRQMERQPSPWLASVARVSRTGNGRITPRDAGRHIAEMRASLGR